MSLSRVQIQCGWRADFRSCARGLISGSSHSFWKHLNSNLWVKGEKVRCQLLLVIAFAVTIVKANPDSLQTSALHDTVEASAQTVMPAKAENLLPDQMGPMEKLLWSKNGWVRSAFNESLTVDNREKEMKWRRTMLTAHEIFGLT